MINKENSFLKFYPFQTIRLPAKFLSNKDIFNFALVSKQHWSTLKDNSSLETAKFLYYVMASDWDMVAKMLSQNINLTYACTIAKDLSGRTFHCSGFAYAVWSLDIYMLDLMLDYTSQHSSKENIKDILLEQYYAVTTKGLTYALNNKKIYNSKHFDFDGTIIKELSEFEQLFNVSNYYIRRNLPINIDSLDLKWVEGVGNAQKFLPMHVVREYCSTKFFNKNIDLHNRPISFNRKTTIEMSSRFRNEAIDKNDSWFSSHQLGKIIAIYRGGGGCPVGVKSLLTINEIGTKSLNYCFIDDLEVFKILVPTRKKQIIDFEEKIRSLPISDYISLNNFKK